MMTYYLLAAVLFPFLLALMSVWRPFDWTLRWFFPLASAPALGMALYYCPVGYVGEIPYLLLGVELGLDKLGQVFLVLTSLIWMVCGFYAQFYFTDRILDQRFRFYYLATLCGNLGLIVAMDVVTFYTFFAIMTMAGYGLVTHVRSPGNLAAGRFYISYALVGELFILSALMLATHVSESTDLRMITKGISESAVGHWIYALIFLGFGTKVGLVPIHAWLPRSYYAAPLPAVAILSGAMSKAGIFGWLRFLPIGEISSLNWSMIMIVGGALTAFYGALVGLVQTRARTALAFSSLSQMGYLTMAVGVCLEPGISAEAGMVAVVIYAFHHAFTKTALFLGIDLLPTLAGASWMRKVVMGALGILSISLVGLPYTSGAYAKYFLKNIGAHGEPWQMIATPLLVLGSVATALLMIRFLILSSRVGGEPRASFMRWLSWSIILCVSVIGAWLLPWGLRTIGFADLEILTFQQYVSGLVPVVICLIPIAYGMRRVLWQQSELTPRPLDGFLGWSHQTFAVDLPENIRWKARYISSTTRRFISKLRLERRANHAIAFASKIQTGWRLGTAMLLAVWLFLWLCLGLGV